MENPYGYCNIIYLLLAGCGTDNANDTAMRNQDNTLRNVNYNPNNNNGYPD